MAQYYPPLLRLKPIRAVLRDSQRALLGLHPGELALADDGKTPAVNTETLARTRNVKRLGATYEVRTKVWAREPDPDPEGLMTITDHAHEARCVARMGRKADRTVPSSLSVIARRARARRGKVRWLTLEQACCADVTGVCVAPVYRSC